MKTTLGPRQVSFSGTITENCELFNLFPSDNETVLVDFSEIKLINSIGVKHWILWTVGLSRTCLLIFDNCPIVIVNQCSTVNGFWFPQMLIKSFYAYFTCPQCSAESSWKLENEKHYWQTGPNKGKVELPTDIQCQRCRISMEPDFFPEKTLKFLKL